jgi:hypothetical protein
MTKFIGPGSKRFETQPIVFSKSRAETDLETGRFGQDLRGSFLAAESPGFIGVLGGGPPLNRAVFRFEVGSKNIFSENAVQDNRS